MKNHKDIIIGLGFVLIVIGILFAVSKRPTQSNNQPNSAVASVGALAASENFFDFGTISMAKGKVSRTYKVVNSTDQPLTINKVYTSCMCTEATLEKDGEKFGPFGMAGHGFVPSINQVLKAGDQAAVEAVFDPAAHGPAGIGLVERIVYVETNSGRPLELSFKAYVTP